MSYGSSPYGATTYGQQAVILPTIIGSMNQTLAKMTFTSATAADQLSGSLSKTLANIQGTFSAAGVLAAALTKTLVSLLVTSAGNIAIAATLTRMLANMGVTGLGGLGITGRLNGHKNWVDYTHPPIGTAWARNNSGYTSDYSSIIGPDGTPAIHTGYSGAATTLGTIMTGTVPIKAGQVATLRIGLAAYGTTTTASVGLYDSPVSSWGLNSDSTARIVSGPGSISRYTGGLWNVSGLSLTELTEVEIIRKYIVDGNLLAYRYLVSASDSNTDGDSVIWYPHVEIESTYVQRVGPNAGTLTEIGYVLGDPPSINYFTNSMAVGMSLGSTLNAAGHGQSVVAGITLSVVAFNPATGEVDVRFQGTAASAYQLGIVTTSQDAYAIPLTLGDRMVGSGVIQLVAGTAPTGTVNVQVVGRTSPGVATGDFGNGANFRTQFMAGQPVTAFASMTVANATTVKGTMKYLFNVDIGEVVDFTVRYSGTQLEKGRLWPTAPIPTFLKGVGIRPATGLSLTAVGIAYARTGILVSTLANVVASAMQGGAAIAGALSKTLTLLMGSNLVQNSKFAGTTGLPYGWSAYISTPTITYGETDPNGGKDAISFAYKAASITGLLQNSAAGYLGRGQKVSSGIWMRADAPTVIYFGPGDSGPSVPISVTTSWQFFTNLDKLLPIVEGRLMQFVANPVNNPGLADGSKVYVAFPQANFGTTLMAYEDSNSIGRAFVALAGTLSETLAPIADTITGTISLVGNLTKTLSILLDTLAATAGVSGTLSKTLAALGRTITGGVSLAGTLNKALGKMVLTSGTVTGSIVGTLSKTLGKLTVASSWVKAARRRIMMMTRSRRPNGL